MNKFIMTCLIIVGLINFIPVLGVLSAHNLEKAYSISLLSNDIVILMRHRALLFGILGGFILYSAFHPFYQVAAMIMAAISMIGYVFLVLHVGDYNAAIFKVLIIDLVGIVFLLAAIILKYLKK